MTTRTSGRWERWAGDAGELPVPWAQDVYQRARDRGARHAHAVRILARAWIRIIWRCWSDRTPYDPTRHGAHQQLLQSQAQPASSPA